MPSMASEQEKAGSAQPETSGSKMVFGDHQGIDAFSQATLREIMSISKVSKEIPCDETFALYSSLPAFKQIMDIEGKKCIELIRKMFKKYKIVGGLTHRDLDEKFDLIIEGNDQLLEKINGDLDEAAGIKKKLDTGVQTVSADVDGAVSGRWNVSTNRATAIILSDSLLKRAFSKEKTYCVSGGNGGVSWIAGHALSGLQLTQVPTLLRMDVERADLQGATVIVCCGSNDVYPPHRYEPDAAVVDCLVRAVKENLLLLGARQVLFLGVPRRYDTEHSLAKEAARQNINLIFRSLSRAAHPLGWLDLDEWTERELLRDGIHPNEQLLDLWKAQIVLLCKRVLLQPRPPPPLPQPASLEMILCEADGAERRVCRLMPGTSRHRSPDCQEPATKRGRHRTASGAGADDSPKTSPTPTETSASAKAPNLNTPAPAPGPKKSRNRNKYNRMLNRKRWEASETSRTTQASNQ